MKYTTIRLEDSEGIATITLNRPESMNAFNREMIVELNHVFNDIFLDSNINVVIITGNENFFAAGADISEVSTITSPVDAYEKFKSVELFSKLEDFDKPIIAAIHGFALGGGCELAMACDLRIAADNCVFGLPEIRIGVIPVGGGTQRLPRLIGIGRAKELLYTGDTIDAQEAYRVGLVNKVVPVDKVMDAARKLASKISRRPAISLRAIKLAVNGGMNMDIKSAMAYESRCFEILFSTEDQKEGMRAFMEKRKPVFKNR